MTQAAAESCSLQSRTAGEPLAGTAPVARVWVVVEQPGPWGRDAIADSHLPEAVRDWLQHAKSLGIGVQLARHPDRPERVSAREHHVWIARSAVGGLRLRHALVSDLSVLTQWDASALAGGVLPPIGHASAEPLLLVCTHSGRDACCALHGRALVTGLLEAASPAQRERVWECSHVGGHRFAPVTVTLPSGAVHGRVPLDQAHALLDYVDTGRVVPELLRGHSALPAPLQAAEVAVRLATGCDIDDALDVLVLVGDRPVPVDIDWAVPIGSTSVEVRHADGRAWRCTVRHVTDGVTRAESCGAVRAPVARWVVDDVAPVTPWRSSETRDGSTAGWP